MNNSSPHFVIVTTIFNHIDRLDKLFECMINQTYRNFTHYIYDDCSSIENPDAKVSEYELKVSKLTQPHKIIYKKGSKNLGVDLAHQVCFKDMKGDFFIWIDVGDYVDNNFLTIARKAIIKHKDCEIIHFNGRHIDLNGFVDSKTISKQIKSKYLRKKNQLPCFCYGNFIYNLFAVNISFFRKVNPECLFLNGNDYGGFFNDYQMMFIFLLSGAKTYYEKTPVFYKLYDNNSVSCSFEKDELLINEGKDYLFSKLDSIKYKRDFYYSYVSIIADYRNMKNNLFLRNYSQNISIYKSIKLFMVQNKLKSEYWQEKFRCSFFYYLSKYRLLRFFFFRFLKG